MPSSLPINRSSPPTRRTRSRVRWQSFDQAPKPVRVPWIICPPAVQSTRTANNTNMWARLYPVILILGILLSPVKASAEVNDPFSAVVRVNRELGGDSTGFAIDDRTVLTAAHCLWLERPRN